MSGLDSIPVHVEGEPQVTLRSENLRPLLQEIAGALEALIADDRPTTIDLTAMPFTEQDEADLRATLGRGEVEGTVSAFGPTRIVETAIAGVWFVEHRDAEDRRLALHLEIARVPEMLMTPRADLADALTALRAATEPRNGNDQAGGVGDGAA